MNKAHDAATSAQNIRAWLFDGKPSNPSEIGGQVLGKLARIAGWA